MSWAASYAGDIARGGTPLHVHQWHVLGIVVVLVNASENLHIVSACLPDVQQRIFQISI